ncbi:MAG: VanW family protein [Oscillospiraceae bacterium]|nr:VanW family protein [Oscillospiraceae bacterium]
MSNPANKRRKLFCELSPTCYKISLCKEYLLRDIHDTFSGERFAESFNTVPLPVVVKSHSSDALRKLEGVDMQLQKNKMVNLRLAAAKINGIIISPGETFSFWHLVGEPTAKKGYLDGLVIKNGKLDKGVGGGLCQLANLIHWLVLNSPLTVTELRHHSDALFPDSGRRVPFGTGTGVFYKNVDYRFKNTTDQPVQLLVWLDDHTLYGELRSTEKFPYIYRITEDNQGFVEENGVFYRVSKVYRVILDRDRRIIRKELVLDNHSKVMYDYSLIPRDSIITPGLRRLP